MDKARNYVVGVPNPLAIPQASEAGNLSRNYVTRVSRKSGVFVSCSGVFSVTRRSDGESKNFTMKNIDFIRRTSLSVPVVGNHSVSETPSPPKVGTFGSNRFYVWIVYFDAFEYFLVKNAVVCNL